ncbi:MAG: RNA polymerase subunit sigma-70 [Candidatus Neomarinimicrobiota bacterium]|nr:MAG: RNA polymerase subunit sigma-70 [Candidatus Neomarinimicrobiota bacterium]
MSGKTNHTSLLVEIARLYYEHNFSQQKIANKLDISRPGVSRLLQQARNRGIVRIEIFDPTENGTLLEEKMQKKFGLKKVIVVPNDNEETQIIKKRLGRVAVTLLEQLVEEGLILGVSWGTTMQEVAKQVRRKSVKDMTVVQLNGGISRAEYDTHASEIAQKISEKYQAIPFLLPLPAIVDSAELKQAIIYDKNISRTLDLARKAKVAIFTIGSFNHDSVLVKADYFETKEVDSLLKRGAVGDICSRIITHDGKICSPELNSRTIGIELEELRKKPYSIAVAGGKEKLQAIHAGLRGHLFNVFITDEWVAEELLRD